MTCTHCCISHFPQFWQKQSNTLSFSWTSYSLSTADRVRREYRRDPSINQVTHQPTVYYPGWKRKLWYLFSIPAMLPLLSLGVATMTLSLNLNGYVKNTKSPIYVEYLARYGQSVSILLSLLFSFVYIYVSLGWSVCW